MSTLNKIVALSFLMILIGFSPSNASDAPLPPKQNWSYKLTQNGSFDRAKMQRGFQVYKQVCAVCHSLNLLAYRNLKSLGFNEGEIKAIAAEYTLKDGPNDEGEMFERPARPEDRFVSPYPNEKASRAANNGAYPPDLSLITKARPFGPDYIYALLTGYSAPPEGIKVMEGMHYNAYFPGHQIAMAPPLVEGAVTFSDGTNATVQQMAEDVVTFLAWVAEPEMEERHQMGIMVMLFLFVFTILMYFVMRRVWQNVK
jgi:ubiquinol-cytochrome c reductase cytochrome c1 subunit